MKRIPWTIGLLVWLFSTAVVMVPPSPAEEAPAMVVGRIFTVEGDLLRYVPETRDWVAVVRDAPFSTDDTLFSGASGVAELIAPNGAWIRIGGNTQIQFIALEADLAETDVATGVGRFYNKGTETVIKATSPFGYVLADPGTVFDFFVGENSVEVVAIKGTVSFVHATTDARYDVNAGSPSILADRDQVSSGEGTVDPEWDRWNTDRENFWKAKTTAGGKSVEYLPPSLQHDAYALEENGRWERVPYDGAERWFWRPTTVAVGWSPFTVGRWTDWHGEQTWIPAEPFGYATHHYGNWIYVGNYWYWAPPVASVRIGFPLLDVGFFWWPGRVSWIHSGSYIGWVPLAPHETYYSRRPWGGPRTVVVTDVTATRININIGSYAYINRAVIVNRSNFFRRNSYRDVRVTSINRTTIINNYRAAPVVDNRVIRNYTTIRERYNYTNTTVKEKPHTSAIDRIRHNETIIHGDRKEKAALLQERMKGIPEGRVNREARIEQPRSTNYVVPVNDASRPKAELKLPQREIRGSSTGAPLHRPGQAGEPTGVSPARPARPGAPASPSPERVIPARPAQPGQPRPERAAPPRPGQQPRPVQPEQPAPKSERIVPTKPAQPEQPAARPPERAMPARPAQPRQPKPERAAPARPPQQPRPVQPEQPAPKSERIVPTKPAQPEQPAARPPERVMPARPAQTEQPRPERAAPARPPQQPTPVPSEEPAPKTERILPARPAQPVEPAARPPERVMPARPAQPEQPKAERIAPARPPQQPRTAQPEQSTPRPERVLPARPVQPVEPAVRTPERVTPAKPAQSEQPRPKPVQAIPAKPVQPGESAEDDERVKPAKPGQSDRGRPGR